jgi:hypothetical protein
MTLTNLNCVHEEITSILNSVNAYYNSVQNLLFCSFVSKNVNIKICRNIILSVVLYECQTWPFTRIEEHRLRVVVGRVLRNIYGHKRNKVAGDWWRLHDEELYDLYSSSNINQVIKLRIIRLVGHVARSGKEALHTGFV